MQAYSSRDILVDFGRFISNPNEPLLVTQREQRSAHSSVHGTRTFHVWTGDSLGEVFIKTHEEQPASGDRLAFDQNDEDGAGSISELVHQLRKADCAWHEVVFESQPRKLVFDIDGVEHPHTLKEVCEQVVEAVYVAGLQTIRNKFLASPTWLVMGSPNKTTSCHLMLTNFYFDRQQHIKLHEEMLKNLPAEYHKYIDRHTIASQFQLRLPGSNKYIQDSNNEWQLVNLKLPIELGCEFDSLNAPTFGDCCITVTDQLRASQYAVEKQEAPLWHNDYDGAGVAAELLQQAKEQGPQALKAQLEAFAPRVLKMQEDGKAGNLYFTRLESMWCPLCSRTHNNDNTLRARVYVGETGKAESLWFGCTHAPRDSKPMFVYPDVQRQPNSTATVASGKDSRRKAEKKLQLLTDAIRQYRKAGVVTLRSVHDVRQIRDQCFESFTQAFDYLASCYWWSETDGVWYREGGKWINLHEKSGVTTMLMGLHFEVDGQTYQGSKVWKRLVGLFNRKQAVFTDQVPYGLQPALDEPFNTFQRPELAEPSPSYKDNVAMLERFVQEQLASSEAPEFGRYLLDWCSHVVQRPCTKTGVMVALCGSRGSGKSMFLDLLCKIVGSSAVQVNNRGLDLVAGKFNGTLRQKTLLSFGELVSGRSITERELGALKSIITDCTMSIEYKGREAFNDQSYINVIAACNDPRSVTVEAGDRRICVISGFDTAHDNEDVAYWQTIIRKFSSQEFISDIHRMFATRNIQEFTPGLFPKSEMRELAVRQSKLAMYLLQQAKSGRFVLNESIPVTKMVKDFCYETGDLNNPLTLASRLRIEVSTHAELMELWRLSEDKETLLFGPKPPSQATLAKPAASLTFAELRKLLRSKGVAVGGKDTKAVLLDKLAALKAAECRAMLAGSAE